MSLKRPSQGDQNRRERTPPRDGVKAGEDPNRSSLCAPACDQGLQRGEELGRRSQWEGVWAAGKPALEEAGIRVDGLGLMGRTSPVRWKPALPAGSG